MRVSRQFKTEVKYTVKSAKDVSYMKLLSGIVESTLYLCVVLSDSTTQQLTKDSSRPRLCFCWHMGFSVLYFMQSKKRSL